MSKHSNKQPAPQILIAPDIERCQAQKPNGSTAFSMGGRPKIVRCDNKPNLIVSETEASEADGLLGAMSLCLDCYIVFRKQQPNKLIDLQNIKEYHE